VSRFRLKTLAQAIDIRLRRTDLAEKFDLARAERIGDRDRVLVTRPTPASVREIAGCGTVHTVRLWQQC
jgi:hypothetical protein